MGQEDGLAGWAGPGPEGGAGPAWAVPSDRSGNFVLAYAPRWGYLQGRKCRSPRRSPGNTETLGFPGIYLGVLFRCVNFSSPSPLNNLFCVSSGMLLDLSPQGVNSSPRWTALHISFSLPLQPLFSSREAVAVSLQNARSLYLALGGSSEWSALAQCAWQQAAGQAASSVPTSVSCAVHEDNCK